MRRLVGAASSVAFLALVGPVRSAPSLIQQVDAYRLAHERAIVSELDELTHIRSVAAEPAGLAFAADRLQELLRARGFETAQLKDVSGGPALVVGSFKSPGATRTVVFYAHYDGQPVTASQWSSDPFVPVMRSSRTV